VELGCFAGVRHIDSGINYLYNYPELDTLEVVVDDLHCLVGIEGSNYYNSTTAAHDKVEQNHHHL